MGLRTAGWPVDFVPVPAAARYHATARPTQVPSEFKFNPAESIGDNACPFTTLYWDYLHKHADTLAKNPRMVMQLKNLHRLSEEKREAIALQAQQHKQVIYAST